MYHMKVTDKDDGIAFICEGKRELVLDALIHLFPKVRLIGEDTNRWAYATAYHNILITRSEDDPQYKKEVDNDRSNC